MTNGTKVKCNNCDDMFHVTCARQAGLEVADGEPLKCFKHVRSQFVLRSRLEDMLWVEKMRWSNSSFRPNAPMSWNHAAALLHFAIDILRTIGWAWRWTEWWVENGDNWEPFLPGGEDEEDMSNEELKMVGSTKETRRIDARHIRLEDIGAALRNRSYDLRNSDGLEKALAKLLNTSSLVGPLEEDEIEFFITWFSLAYKSKCRKLGFGGEKIPVSNDGFCVRENGSPKHCIGKRRLP